MDSDLDEDRGVIGFDIRVDPGQFGPDLIKATARVVRYRLRKAIDQAIDPCKKTFKKSLENSREYRGISNELVPDFGLVDPDANRTAIVNEVVQGLSIRPKTVRSSQGDVTDFGGLEIVILPSYLLFELVSMDFASFTSEKGNLVNWLYWLLFTGNAIAIADYEVAYGDVGRTGQAIMIKSGSFRVPQQFAGTPENNWITRAANNSLPRIRNIIEKTLREVM